MARRAASVPTLPPLDAAPGLRAEPGASASCEQCASPRVTRISMTLTDGTPVDFTSCHVCEHKSWARTGGDALTLPTVLDSARKPR